MTTIFRTINGRVIPIRTNTVEHSSSQVRIPKQSFNSKTYSSFSSFTTPNATCPVCYSKVFYYEHPNGARVYFDELGPPWPKHPCTINNRAPKKQGLLDKPKTKSNSWLRCDWKPLIIVSTVILSSGKSVRIQAKTDQFTVRFELSEYTLKKAGYTFSNVDLLLMQSKLVTNDEILIQIHSGTVNWELKTRILKKPSTTATVVTKSKKLEYPTATKHNSHSKQNDQITKVEVPFYFKVSKSKFTFYITIGELTHTVIRSKQNLISKGIDLKNMGLKAYAETTDDYYVYYLQHKETGVKICNFDKVSLNVNVPNNQSDNTDTLTLSNEKELNQCGTSQFEITDIIEKNSKVLLFIGTFKNSEMMFTLERKDLRVGESVNSLKSGNRVILLSNCKNSQNYNLHISKHKKLLTLKPRTTVNLTKALERDIPSNCKASVNPVLIKNISLRNPEVTLISHELASIRADSEYGDFFAYLDLTKKKQSIVLKRLGKGNINLSLGTIEAHNNWVDEKFWLVNNNKPLCRVKNEPLKLSKNKTVDEMIKAKLSSITVVTSKNSAMSNAMSNALK